MLNLEGMTYLRGMIYLPDGENAVKFKLAIESEVQDANPLF